MSAPAAPAPRSASLAEAFFAAAHLVTHVIGGRNFDVALEQAKLSGPLRGAAMDLAYSTLRACGRGDFILARLIERPLKDDSVRALLLCALARLEARPDDAHTGVDQAVSAAQRLAGGNFKGLVNGVLRNFLRRRAELLAAADAERGARLCHPAWWIKRLQQDHPSAWENILAAGNSHPPMALRVNRRRVAAADFQTQLQTAGIAAQAHGDGLLLDKPVPVERIPGFADGLCSVQDLGAQQAARLLDVAPGMRVLDACAAPGGKTAHIIESTDCALTALDSEAARAARIDQNLSRLGLAATVKVADCRALDTWWDGAPFDRILADVPCSASGVARRHPDVKWLRRERDIAGFAATQRAILDALWQTLAPGGKMLYATCSVFAEENSRQVSEFVGRHADALRLNVLSASGDAAPELQLLPDAEHDGFYYALLQKA